MTVRLLEKMLKKIKDKDMPVMLDNGEGLIISACYENSQVIEIPLIDEEDLDDEDFEDDDPINDFHEYDLEEQETIEILLLVPCSHPHETEIGELNSQPELN